jgi:hypothetical protein
MKTPAPTSQELASNAAHRFGLGEADLSVVGVDPRRWLLNQLGPAEQPPADTEGFLSSADLVQMRKSARRAKKAAQRDFENRLQEAATDLTDVLGAELSVSGLSSHLKLPLLLGHLAMGWNLAT